MLRMVDGADNVVTSQVTEKYQGKGSFDPTWGFRSFANGEGGMPFAPRTGLRCYFVQSGAGQYVEIAPIATGIMGAAMYGAAQNVPRFFFSEGTTAHICIRSNSDGSISIVRGRYDSGTTLATSAAGVIPASGWNYYEAKATIHDSTGYVEVRKNGVNVVSFTGDTRNGGATGLIDRLHTGDGALFGGPNDGGTGYDDLYYADSDTGEVTDFVGDCKVETIKPTAEGAASDFTPSAGSDNALNVDENTSDGDTTYNASNTVGHIDSYVMADLSTVAGSVKGVQVMTVMRKDDAGSRSARARILSNAVAGNGATRALSDSYQWYADVFEHNPDGDVDWTISSVNAMQAGVEVVS
jgi:hypothetical protein